MLQGTRQYFDSSTFNLQRTIKGTVYISWAAFTSAGTHAPIFQLQKVAGDGTTAAVTTNVTGGNADTDADIGLTALETTGAVVIGSGDKLRLVITNDIGDGNTITMGCDPMERDDAGAKLTTKTSLKVHVPFRIDL